MKLLVASLILLIATIAVIVGISHKPLELQVDQHNSGAWLNYAGGEWCDVRPDPKAKPRGQYDYIPGAKRQGAIA